MKKAVLETQRRRKIQQAYNETHGIKPKTVVKKISDIRQESRNAAAKSIEKVSQNMSASQLPKLIQTLEKDMKNASDNLEFELAAVLRDQIETLKNMPFINATDQLS
jgi:excinuclease ABC subunit B